MGSLLSRERVCCRSKNYILKKCSNWIPQEKTQNGFVCMDIAAT